jgi:hypothetical protein
MLRSVQQRTITPLNLQLGGGGTMEIPEVKFDLNPSLTKQLLYVDKTNKEF